MFAELFTPEQLTILGQIIFIDLVLAGDNAIIIGMVASKFPVEQRKKVIFWGIGGAVILRIILTMLTAYLLQITGLRLIGGLLLLYIVYKLYDDVIKGQSDEDDIVVRHTVDSKDYLFDKKSYCRDRTSNKNLSWDEDFNEEILSRKTWKYAVSNGFKDRGRYISGWGNGELQYYTCLLYTSDAADE